MTPNEHQRTLPAFAAPGVPKWLPLVSDKADDKDQREEVRKAKDELRNVLLASLQMQHLVVLAGSGCSLAAGGRSMADLWKAVVGDKPTDAAKKVAQKVRYDLTGENIEAFLSRAEAFCQINDDIEVSEWFAVSKCTILDQCSGF